MIKKDKILVICHDAGGSEILSSYLIKDKGKSEYHVLAAGPGTGIFSRKKLTKLFVSPESADRLVESKKIDLVMTATSWASGLELDFIKKAKINGLRSVAFLDHWTNYRERFGYPRGDWKNNLPDEIWTGDDYAFGLARRYFRGLTVKKIENPYFEDIKKQYALLDKKNLKNPDGILFICEPLSVAANSFGDKSKKGFSEFEVLHDVLARLSEKAINRQVIIRPHPSEQPAKYDGVIAGFRGRLKISLSRNRNILSDMIRCSHVVGYESMGLVVGVLCQKEIISYAPARNRCVLPFKQIYKISNIKKLTDYII